MLLDPLFHQPNLKVWSVSWLCLPCLLDWNPKRCLDKGLISEDGMDDGMHDSLENYLSLCLCVCVCAYVCLRVSVCGCADLFVLLLEYLSVCV